MRRDQDGAGVQASEGKERAMTSDPRNASTLGEAAMNPDGTYNAIKALSWLSDALNPGRGLPESDVPKIAADVMSKRAQVRKER